MKKFLLIALLFGYSYAQSPAGGACSSDADCTGDNTCVESVCTVPEDPINDGTAADCNVASDNRDKIAYQNLNCGCKNDCE